MMRKKNWNARWLWGLVLCLLWACSGEGSREEAALKVPRGYMPVLEFIHNGRLLRFGPFVGYYFRPEVPGNMRRIRLV